MKGSPTLLWWLLMLTLPILSCGRGARSLTAASPTAAGPTLAADQASPEVPQEFAELYAELSSLLDAGSAAVDARWDGTTNEAAYATELLAANGNRGEDLLGTTALDGSRLMLDRFQDMGIDAVKVTITYPLLSAEYPRSGEYLDFYRQAVADAHQRGLTVLVGIGLTFTEPEFSTETVDYSGYTLDEFKADRRAYAELIIDQVGPDYLTVLNEPGTMIHIAPGLSELNQPAKYREVLETITQGLDRKGVLIGAGAGSWEHPEFFRQAAASDLDYIDLHVYPLQRGFFEQIFDVLDSVRAAGKRTVIGEAWLYKIADSELDQAGAVAVEMFGRDTFSFWSPLDSSYIEIMSRLARYNDVELISFFWGAKHFFAYLDYDHYRNASPATLLAQSSVEAAQSIAADRLTQ